MAVNAIQSVVHFLIIDPIGHIPFAGPVLKFILGAVL